MLGTLFVIASIAELMLYAPYFWRVKYLRLGLTAVCIIVLSLILGAALFLDPRTLLVVLAVVQVYRIVNLYRIAEGRMNQHYLRQATKTTSIRLIGLQLLIAAIGYGAITFEAPTAVYYVAISVVGVVSALLTYRTASSRIKDSEMVDIPANVPHANPTVTIAIPARNEDRDLEECLRSVVASNYSKLEILVLDDCSQLRRTPEIIRGFAQKGVRFVKGSDIRPHWLAKNQAYDTLADHASGEIILFCGVDVRFAPDTVQQLVDQMVYRKKSMLSVMPIRSLAVTSRFSFIQTNRYAREFILPSFLLKRPPVLSSCWLIQTKQLYKHGGFDAVRRTIAPEGYFAANLNKDNLYSFVRSNSVTGLHSVKSTRGQQNTAIRTLYPQLKKKPESVLLLLSMYALTIYAPVVLVVLALLSVIPLQYVVPNLVTVIVLYVAYLRTSNVLQHTTLIKYALYAPIAAFVDIIYIHSSLIKYEFSEVVWKGRNICEPIMHVEPRLPELG